jgi:hypothetical protein
MEPADPDFYRIGYARMMRAYGIEFLEGPDGMGVYASRDVEPLRRARVSPFSISLLLQSLARASPISLRLKCPAQCN